MKYCYECGVKLNGDENVQHNANNGDDQNVGNLKANDANDYCSFEVICVE